VFSGSASTIIIDVTGATSLNLSSVNFNVSGDLNRQIIWNFEGATSLTFRGWHGTVLAENATVTNSSAMEGDLYAAKFNGNGELHDFTFDGTLPGDPSNVPEPASLALLSFGLAGLVAIRRRQHQPA
jgi:choice-of-anchor A domain-containing protein